MNWKAALILFVILFVSAATTVAISLNAPKLGRFGTERITTDLIFEPMGDHVGGPGAPH